MALQTLPSLPGLEFPITRTNLGFNVNSHESISGFRTRFPQRSLPQYRWTISFSFLRDFAPLPVLTPFSDGTTFSDGTEFAQGLLFELQQLAGFYNSLNGTALPFLYTEPNDSVAASQQFGIGDGVTKSFQLTRTWGRFTEPVFSATIAYLSIGAALTSAYTLSPAGVVTFTTAPAAGMALQWSGTYQWICRFDDDNLDFENFMASGNNLATAFWALKKLTFSSEPLSALALAA